jgi:hypothetical protein
MVYDLGFRLGFRVDGLGFKLAHPPFKTTRLGLGFRVKALGIRV